MKVYVVTSGEYSDYHIDAVCIDKATAETIAHSIEENGYDYSPYVAEYDTDDYSAKSAKMWNLEEMSRWANEIDPGEVIAINFSKDIDKPSKYQTKDGKWHEGRIKNDER